MALRAQLKQVTAERDDLQKLLDAKPVPSSAAPPTASPAAPKSEEPGSVLGALESDMSFMSPRGRFKPSFAENALLLQGKTVSVVIHYSNIRYTSSNSHAPHPLQQHQAHM